MFLYIYEQWKVRMAGQFKMFTVPFKFATVCCTCFVPLMIYKRPSAIDADKLSRFTGCVFRSEIIASRAFVAITG